MENSPTKKSKKSKFDLKNISPEERNKYVAIGVFGLVIIGVMFYGITNYTSEEKTEEVTEFTNPEAEQSKYNSKLDALNPKSPEQSSNSLEYTFSPSDENGQTNGDPDFTQLDKQLSELGSGKGIEQNTVPNSSSSSSPGTSSSGPSNSHNVYGDYSMWQNKEPSNSKIGYSSKKRPVEQSATPTRQSSSPSYSEVNTYQPEPTYREPVLPSYEEKKSITLAQVKSKLISQGEASNNRSISFVILENFTLNGETIQKGKSYAIGSIKIESDRILAKINTIKANGKTYSVLGKILGYDGEEGLPLKMNDDSGSGQSTGGIIKDEAIRQVGGRIPIVGGIISRASGGGSNSKANKISLSGNIECTIVIYK